MGRVLNLYLVAFPLIGVFRLTHPITGDEATNILLYSSDWRTLFSRTYPNNHVVSSVFGYLLSNALGYNVIVFRLVSLVSALSLSLLVWAYLVREKHILAAIISLTVIYTAPLFLPYSSLFRGYVVQMVLVFSGAAQLYDYVMHRKLSSLIVSSVLFGVGMIHMLTTIYIWVPALISLFVCRHNKGDLVRYVRVLLPVGIAIALMYSVSIIVTGYAVARPETPNVVDLFTRLNRAPHLLLSLGFDKVFLHEALNPSTTLNAYLDSVLWQAGDSPYYYVALCLLIVTVLVVWASPLREKSRSVIAFASFVAFCVGIQVFLHRPLPERTLLMYLPFFAVVIGLTFERIGALSPLMARLSSGQMLLIASYLCFAVSLSIGWHFLTVDYSKYVDQVYLPSDTVIKDLVNDQCDDPISVDGDAHIRKYIAFYSQQECNRKWSLKEIRAFIKERRLFSDASVYIQSTNQKADGIAERAISPESYKVTYQDAHLVVLKRD